MSKATLEELGYIQDKDYIDKIVYINNKSLNTISFNNKDKTISFFKSITYQELIAVYKKIKELWR